MPVGNPDAQVWNISWKTQNYHCIPQGYRLVHLGSEIVHFEPCNSLKGELCQAVALPLVQV